MRQQWAGWFLAGAIGLAIGWYAHGERGWVLQPTPQQLASLEQQCNRAGDVVQRADAARRDLQRQTDAAMDQQKQLQQHANKLKQQAEQAGKGAEKLGDRTGAN